MGTSCITKSTDMEPSPTTSFSSIVTDSDTSNAPQQFSTDQLSISLPPNQCNLDLCNGMDRIKYILSHHEDDVMKHGPYTFINANLNQYNNTHLIDDFHHLMFVHQHQFEEIYNKLSLCHLDKCTSFTRNHRDRSNINSKRLYDQYINTSTTTKDINTVQIIDQIHCYFLHSFDTIYKLNKDDQNKLNTQIEAMNLKQQQQNDTDLSVDDIDDSNNDSSQRVRAMSEHLTKTNTERNMTRNISPRSRFNSVNTRNRAKYCELETKLSEETMKNDKVKYNIENDIVYSFGVRFVYDSDKRHEEWYITPKYKSLKQELIENNYKEFGIEQWNVLYEKAMQYSKSRRIQKECIFIDTGDVAVTKRRPQSMSIDHLISIMIYCNFDRLQSNFSASFRKESNDSNDDLKRKHCEWRQMGYYLREIVEIYGTKISSFEGKLRKRKLLKYNKKYKFFHGINTEMVFVSTSSRIYGPLSTSSSELVALVFAGSDGLLLELTGNNARFFDCCGISDYSNENEKLFLGGYDPLLIETVINPRTMDYRPYIKAINIISCLFNGHQYYGGTKKAFRNKTKKLVYSLLFNNYHKMDKENGIEPYVERLFNHYTKNVTQINIDWRLMNMDHDDLIESVKGFKFIKNAICMKTFDWIKMNRVIALFEHLEVIELKYIRLSKEVMDYIFHVLKTKSNDEMYQSLNKIVMFQPLQHNGMMIDDVLEIYGDKFRQKIKWIMAVEYTNDYLDLVIKKST